MSIRIVGLILGMIMLQAPTRLTAEEARPRSILFLDQSETRGPFFQRVFAEFRAVIDSNPGPHTTLYAESLDLSRFRGVAYEHSLQRHFQVKYQDNRIGVVVAVGAATLDFVLRWRGKLWPDATVVFAMLDEIDLARQDLPPDSTGSIVRLPLADTIIAARAVVPGLDQIVFVGEPWDRQVVFRNWGREKATAAAGLKVTELLGLPLAELRKRVAELPERSAIIYAGIYSDGCGGFFPPATALSLIAETANRPIITAAETFLAAGGIGGFSLIPSVIGADAARLAMRILNGESPSDIPVAVTPAVKPLFNWQQMERWGVNEADLPPGSEIRFHELSFWERYRWQSMSVLAVVLMQAGLISVLLHERRKRNDAEAEARHRMTELAHANRQATAGELSSSIAHELNQPLGAILTNAETGELILNSPEPDLTEVREILADIRRDDLRASEVIHRMRNFLKRTPFEASEIDINDTVREVFEFLSIQASARNVALYLKPASEPLRVRGDAVQLQQVVLNLVVNSMDAMAAMPYGRTVIGKTEKTGGASVLISISDSGPGISSGNVNEVFDPFYTTKKQGMGIGLSIARTIVQAHKGRIWAENQAGEGAVFRLSLPLAI